MKIIPISVIIPTMNRPETLESTLECIFSYDFIPNEVIIVDQSQNIKSVRENKRIVEKYSNVFLIYQEIPSLTKARNIGMKYVNNEIIIFSDDDVEIYKDTIYTIYNLMQNKSIAMIAALDDNLKESRSVMGYFFNTKSFIKRKKGHVTLSMLGRYPYNVQQLVETEWAMGYYFVIRKSLIDKWAIKWDEKLTSYAYAEDLDFSYSYYKNCKKEGLHCVLSENIHVKHLASKEYRIPSKKSWYMYVINRTYLSYKHNMGLISRLAMLWCNIAVALKGDKKSRKYIFDAMKIVYCNMKKISNGDIANLY